VRKVETAIEAAKAKQSRKIAFLIADSFDDVAVSEIKRALLTAGAA
jgi:hypothetical protein